MGQRIPITSLRRHSSKPGSVSAMLQLLVIMMRSVRLFGRIDHFRVVKIAILILLLLGTCTYHYVKEDEHVVRYLNGLSEGEIAHLPYWKVVNKQRNLIRITDNTRFLDVYPGTDDIQRGYRVSLTVIKRGESLYLQKYHTHTTMRRVKIWVSILPLLTIFLLFLREYRIDKSKWVFMLRNGDY